MQTTSQPMIVIAILLAALAGFVDALAFSSMGFFASFMSGNSTRLGVAVATHSPLEMRMALALIFAFVAGVIVASVLSRRFPRWRQPIVMAKATGLLAIAALVPDAWRHYTVLLIAMAMGVENGVFQRDGEVSIGLTYMTGSLVKLGQHLAGALMGDADRWSWVPFLLLWSGFVAGVVLGAQRYVEAGLGALWYAVAAGAVLSALLALLTKSELAPMRVSRVAPPAER